MTFRCVIFAIATCAASAAFAGHPPEKAPKQPPADLEQHQGQGQQQTLNGGTVTVTERSLALMNGSAHPITGCPPGWIPGRKAKRAWQSPLLGVSAICERDQQAIDDLERAREHELRLLELRIAAARAEAERDREAAARIRAELDLTRTVRKGE